jgi:hypothetical protein
MTSGGVKVSALRAAVGVVAVLSAALAGCGAQCELNGDCEGAADICQAGTCQAAEVYALKGRDVQKLGTWPALSTEGGTKAFDVVAPEDRSRTASELFGSGFLVSNGTHLLTGYTTSDCDASFNCQGKVAVHALEGGTSEYVSAPSNFTAAAVGGVFLVNGAGLGGASAGKAVYGFRPGGTPAVVATAGLPEGTSYASGATVVTSGDIAVIGFSVGFPRNLLRAVPAGALEGAVISGPAASLEGAPVVYDGTDVQGVVAAGNGVVLSRGTYNASFALTRTDLLYVPVSPPEGSAQQPVVGTPATLLRFEDKCTTLLGLDRLGSDLLVRVSDKNGRRAVRIRPGTGAAGEDKGSNAADADCATKAHDPALGTLTLKPGFRVVDTAPFANGLSSLGVVAVPRKAGN